MAQRLFCFGPMPLRVHAFLSFVLAVPALTPSFVWPACVPPPSLHHPVAHTNQTEIICPLVLSCPLDCQLLKDKGLILLILVLSPQHKACHAIHNLYMVSE